MFSSGERFKSYKYADTSKMNICSLVLFVCLIQSSLVVSLNDSDYFDDLNAGPKNETESTSTTTIASTTSTTTTTTTTTTTKTTTTTLEEESNTILN